MDINSPFRGSKVFNFRALASKMLAIACTLPPVGTNFCHREVYDN